MDDEYEDWIEEELADEVWWASILIQNNKISSDVFNSFEWVNTCLQQLKNPYVRPHLSDKFLELFDELSPNFISQEYADSFIFDDEWRGVETLQSFGAGRQLGLFPEDPSEAQHKENGAYLTPVEYLLSYIRVGSIPPAELLISVAKAFELYFMMEGKLSLEEVFFGKPPARLGCYAKRRLDSFKGINFRLFEHSVRRGEGETLEKLAETFISNAMHEQDGSNLALEDIDAFLRKYRRWKERSGVHKERKPENGH